MKFCPNCGAQVDPNATFCTKCGHKLNKSANKPAQPTQVQNNVQSTVPMNMQNQNAAVNNQNTAGPSFSSTKNLSQKQIIAIVAVVVIILAAVFGWHSYQSKPSHNANNPLARESFIINKESGENELEFSSKNYGDVWRNIYMLAYKKLGASKQIIDEMKTVDPQDWYWYYHTGKNSAVEEVLNEDKDIKREVASDLDDAFPDGDPVIYTNPKKATEGDKVEVKNRLPKWFLTKYGLDGRPVNIKISKINHISNFK